MTGWQRVCSAWLGLAACALSACGGEPSTGSRDDLAKSGQPLRPNIIFILTDDQAPGTLGFEGNRFVHTPNLDRLAREGAYFSRAYVPTPQCAPSRAAILTGLYPHQNGVVSNENPAIREGLATFPRLLIQRGYRCGLVGKWHHGEREKPQQGFDDFWVTFPGYKGYRNPMLNVNGEKVSHTGIMPKLLTDYAIQFVEQHADEPFFLWLAYKTPHAPYEPPPKRFRVADPSAIPLPESVSDDLTGKPRVQRESQMHRLFESATTAQVKEMLASRYGMISCLDHHVGRLLDTLERLGLESRTLVIYMSDHGLLGGEHQLLEKGSAVYEELVRTPLIMRWPGKIRAGTRVDALVSSMDLFPTICNGAGAPVPEGLAGRDLWGLLRGETTSVHDALFFEVAKQRNEEKAIPLRGLVTPRYKYGQYLGDGGELYDLESDPREMRNLFDEAAHAETAAVLGKKLADWRRETGDMD